MSTNDNSINEVEIMSNQVPILEQNIVLEESVSLTPSRPTTPVEQNAPIRNDQKIELKKQFEELITEEQIHIPKIKRLPFNLDENTEVSENQDIHYCGNKDCEGDCGVLVCGCIDMCRNRCGTRSYSF